MTKDKQLLRSLPANLMVDGRESLVVGGGRAALDPLAWLMAAGAEIRLVAPLLDPETEKLLGSGGITHVARLFEPTDVEGSVLVFAATGSRSANRQVLASCRAKKIPCCCIDGNWHRGDFTVPAVARHGSLMLSVSSGSNTTQYARMVRDNLARHLQLFESVHLVVVGTDHHHMTVEERAPFHLASQRLEHVGFMIAQLLGIHEFMILNTCNRVEVIAVVAEETAHNGILQHVMGFGPLTEEKYYLRTGYAAFEHLCLVAAGMLSQTPGEKHVTAQVKGALDLAKTRGWAAGMLQTWLSTVLHVSKAIKKQAAQLIDGDEIDAIALRYLLATVASPGDTTLMVLGSGVIGRNLVMAGLPQVGRIIWCYHANRPDIPPGAEGRVELCAFHAIKERLAEVDVVISAANAPDHLLDRDHVPSFKPERPILLLDLGMPRNMDPVLDNWSDDITVLDLDGLKDWCRHDHDQLEAVLACSRKIVAEHRTQYDKIGERLQSGSRGAASHG